MIYREYIPSTDPRLRRHVLHDDRSWSYRFPTDGLAIRSVRHARRIPVLDQGDVGSCTGNAGIGCLGTDPYYDTVATMRDGYSLDEVGALGLYSAAESLDGDGPYPPNDNGSTGLSIASVLKARGEISGYQHAFSLDDALKALTVTPFITGVNWYDGMFTPDADGRVHVTGALAGGHEFVADEIDADQQRVWFTNSWGNWGLAGRFYLTFADYGTLLARRGDVTIFVPLTAPAPVPVDADTALAAVARLWVAGHHVAGNRNMQVALKAWLAAKGF